MTNDNITLHDNSDSIDVSDCDQYIQPLLDCGYAWWNKQNELEHLIYKMWIIMLKDGRSPEYIAKVSRIARQRMWEYKDQVGGRDII